jgi:hypothetical protein
VTVRRFLHILRNASIIIGQWLASRHSIELGEVQAALLWPEKSWVAAWLQRLLCSVSTEQC